MGESFAKENTCVQTPKESIKIAYLPNEKELEQVSHQNIPFFSHASEQRFRELFISLRNDAKISSIYITLMVLSTMLATVGLFQGSTAVVELGGTMTVPPGGYVVCPPFDQPIRSAEANGKQVATNSDNQVVVRHLPVKLVMNR